MTKAYILMTSKTLADYKAIRTHAMQIADQLDPVPQLRKSTTDVIEAVLCHDYVILSEDEYEQLITARDYARTLAIGYGREIDRLRAELKRSSPPPAIDPISAD